MRMENMTIDEFMDLLTDHQWDTIEGRKIELALKQTGMKQ